MKENKLFYEEPSVILNPINTEDVITTSGDKDDDKYTGEWDEF